MANGLKNAGFLDGVTGAAASGALLSIDEITFGAEGRAVLRGASQAAGSILLTHGALAVTAGQPFEAFLRSGSVGMSAVTARVGVLSGTGATLGTVALPVQTPGNGAPRRGLPGAFDWRYLRGTMPATGTARIELLGTAAAAGNSLLILKPFIGLNPQPDPQRFDPGAHDNPDLNLLRWPSILPGFDANTVQAQPTPTRKEFLGDAGIPGSRRIGSGRGVRFSAEFNLTLEQRDALDQFFRTTSIDAASDETEFWFLRPDTQQLCFAKWAADGDPADTGQSGGSRKCRIGLILTVA